MIKFSVSHSSILETIGDEVKAVEHAAHLDKIEHMLKNAGATILAKGRSNVTVEMAEETFKKVFDVVEDKLEHFYGEVKLFNSVLGKFINHLEHHCDHQGEGS